jgi:hypothetical protein
MEDKRRKKMITNLKRAITMLLAVIMVAALTACGSSEKIDVSDKIYLGSSDSFETQEVGEALLATKDVSYTVVNGGTTNGDYLAEIENAEYLYGDNIQEGYYVNKDETVILKVFTYEPGSEESVTSADMSPETSEVSTDGNDTGNMFSPKDVSDETIKSIKTYDDYLAMYRAIIEDYFANYEAAVKGTVLYSEGAFADMKKQYDDSFDQQETLYGTMGKSPIVGKDTLVDFLIGYRDSLKEITDSL